MSINVINVHIRQAWSSYQHPVVDSSDKTAESGMHAVSAPMLTLMSERWSTMGPEPGLLLMWQ